MSQKAIGARSHARGRRWAPNSSYESCTTREFASPRRDAASRIMGPGDPEAPPLSRFAGECRTGIPKRRPQALKSHVSKLPLCSRSCTRIFHPARLTPIPSTSARHKPNCPRRPMAPLPCCCCACPRCHEPRRVWSPSRFPRVGRMEATESGSGRHRKSQLPPGRAR